ncbi:hypothetical protein JTB14_031838 [Gonioctena quinquepunctata]|nr:hypothetical protein JTB14_031838 [Gonioctena quinquepunctata]
MAATVKQSHISIKTAVLSAILNHRRINVHVDEDAIYLHVTAIKQIKMDVKIPLEQTTVISEDDYRLFPKEELIKSLDSIDEFISRGFHARTMNSLEGLR